MALGRLQRQPLRHRRGRGRSPAEAGPAHRPAAGPLRARRRCPCVRRPGPGAGRLGLRQRRAGPAGAAPAADRRRPRGGDGVPRAGLAPGPGGLARRRLADRGRLRNGPAPGGSGHRRAHARGRSGRCRAARPRRPGSGPGRTAGRHPERHAHAKGPGPEPQPRLDRGDGGRGAGRGWGPVRTHHRAHRRRRPVFVARSQWTDFGPDGQPRTPTPEPAVIARLPLELRP